MIRMRFSGFLAAILLLLAAVHCSPELPVEMKQGEHQCEHCLMKINDMRFAVQAKTEHGRMVYFDALECMTAYRDSNEGLIPVENVYVSPYNAPGNWVRLRKAAFLLSEKRPSPMGANLSAYSSEQQRDAAMEKLGDAQKMTLQEMSTYVDEQWSKSMCMRDSGL